MSKPLVILSFKNICMVGVSICLLLSITWIFYPQFLLRLWGINTDEGTKIIARRSGALFSGFAIILYYSAKTNNQEIKIIISRGMIITCMLLALLGTYDFFYHSLSAGIFLAVITEITLALLFYLSIILPSGRQVSN